MRERLDETDWKILSELQRDGGLTNVELARRIGMSAPPCLRRVKALEEAGYIRGYRTLFDAKKLGFDVTAFAFVRLVSNAEADIAAFRASVDAMPIVRESWMLSGEVDFLLRCVARDLAAFQAFVMALTGAPNVKTVKTALTLGQTKDEPAAPL